MVAAITAVAFQVIELGGQRQEIRLQLKEMQEANETNAKRFELDEMVFKHERNLWQSRLFKEVQSDQVISGRKSLLDASHHEDVNMTVAFRCSFDSNYYRQWIKTANPAQRMHVDEVISCLESSLPFLNWLTDLAIFSPTCHDDMWLFNEVLFPVSEQIKCLAEAIDNGEVVPIDTWVMGG